jgi:RNA polymerase sigma-70 factor (ECF subfamily)
VRILSCRAILVKLEGIKTPGISERAICTSPLGLIFRMAEKRAAEDLKFSFPSLPPRPSVNGSSDSRESTIENDIVRLYTKNTAVLLRHGLAICGNLEMTQDAIQEAFLRYHIARRKEMIIKDAKDWLLSTMRNYILDRLKEYYFRNGQSLEAASKLTQEDSNLDARIMLGEINATARELLSPRELACLRLRNDGLRYRDIANILNIEPATVGVFLGRALKKIRAALKSEE